MQLITPVAFLVFNRPECTARVLEEIRHAKPLKLFVVADGPRPEQADDYRKCEAVRKIIEERIDWRCDVYKNYADVNMGCAQRVSTGLKWFFDQVEEGIVLEDDCLPSPTFFDFCQDLLSRYRLDYRVGQISGTPFISERIRCTTSYIFSRYGPIWGWASWRRAWEYYDLTLKNWPMAKSLHCLDSFSLSVHEKRVRNLIYERLYQGDLFTWDYQWGYAKLTQSLLSIIPTVNLVENLGFGEEGTHTKSVPKTGYRRQVMRFPLVHPAFVLSDQQFDLDYSKSMAPSRLARLLRGVKRLGGRK